MNLLFSETQFPHLENGDHAHETSQGYSEDFIKTYTEVFGEWQLFSEGGYRSQKDSAL